MLIIVKSTLGPEVGRESMVHYLVKAFMVKHLVSELKGEFVRRGLGEEKALMNAMNCVETEHEEGSVRYDVYVRGDCNSSLGGLVVEVETLYGTGTMVHKLLETINSRCPRGNACRLWVVIPNPQAIIHLPLLLRLRSYVRREYGKDIEFYTLDLTNNRPIKLIDIAKKILNTVSMGQIERRSVKEDRKEGEDPTHLGL